MDPNKDACSNNITNKTAVITEATVTLIDRKLCIEIAKSTLQSIEEGSYEAGGTTYHIKDMVTVANNSTLYYPSDSELSQWAQAERRPRLEKPTEVEVTATECSTLAGARQLRGLLGSTSSTQTARIGVLNFASAKSPGGGFLGGSRAQEESLARSSTLYLSLRTPTAEPFYALHKAHSRHGLYSHAMIYSPGVIFMRADAGEWLPPLAVDIVTAPAVNAGAYRNHLRKQNNHDDTEIDTTMMERMARILYLFELQEVRNLVLGSFGTGAFKNSVELVAGVWRELLLSKGARFRTSFDRVVFAVVDSETHQTFESILVTSAPPS